LIADPPVDLLEFSPAGSGVARYRVIPARKTGLFCVVRLAYPGGTLTGVPAEVEYGVTTQGQWRTAIFPNS
jgi:hypothetical protein